MVVVVVATDLDGQTQIPAPPGSPDRSPDVPAGPGSDTGSPSIGTCLIQV